MAEAALQTMSRERLVSALEKAATMAQSARRSLSRFREAAESPVKVGGELFCGLAGAGMSGVISGLTPRAHKFQYYDTVVGGVVGLASLAAAGSYAGDMISAGAIGLYSPGVSRWLAETVHTKRGK